MSYLSVSLLILKREKMNKSIYPRRENFIEVKREKNEQVFYPEEREKWTNLLIVKRGKNEQVYWSWRERKMNKLIYGEE